MRASFGWIVQWFRDAASAAARPASLPAFAERRPAAAFGHLAMLALILWVLPFPVWFFGVARQGLTAVDREVRARLPAGTAFEIKGGRMTNTLSAPLVFRQGDSTVIVNTATTTLDLKDGEDGLVVGSDAITQQNGPRRQTISLHDAPDFKIDRETFLAQLAHWTPYALFFGSLLAFTLLFGIVLIGLLANAALHALVLWLALRFWKRPWDWKRAFACAVYAATGPFVLRALFGAANVNIGTLPNLWYWLLIGWIAYRTIRKSPLPPETVPASKPESA